MQIVRDINRQCQLKYIVRYKSDTPKDYITFSDNHIHLFIRTKHNEQNLIRSPRRDDHLDNKFWAPSQNAYVLKETQQKNSISTMTTLQQINNNNNLQLQSSISTKKKEKSLWFDGGADWQWSFVSYIYIKTHYTIEPNSSVHIVNVQFIRYISVCHSPRPPPRVIAW